jgi:hypothetical protein
MEQMRLNVNKNFKKSHPSLKNRMRIGKKSISSMLGLCSFITVCYIFKRTDTVQLIEVFNQKCLYRINLSLDIKVATK